MTASPSPLVYFFGQGRADGSAAMKDVLGGKGAGLAEMTNLGISVPLLGGDGWDSPALLEIGGAALEGSYFADHYSITEQRPTVQNFVAKFRAKYQRDPDAVNALSYDAMRMLAEAIRRAGTVEGAAVRDQLAATKDFDGVSGVITMGPGRNPIKPVVIVKVSPPAVPCAFDQLVNTTPSTVPLSVPEIVQFVPPASVKSVPPPTTVSMFVKPTFSVTVTGAVSAA